MSILSLAFLSASYEAPTPSVIILFPEGGQEGVTEKTYPTKTARYLHVKALCLSGYPNPVN